MLIKRFSECIAMFLYLLLAGVAFLLLSPVCYVPGGCVGTPDVLWVSLSVLYILLLPLLCMVFGRYHAIGAYAALTLFFVLFLFAAIGAYTGVGENNDLISYLFCFSLAPFAPLIKSLCDTFSAVRMEFYVQLFLPIAVYAFSMTAYLVGHNSANRRALEQYYEQMRVHETEE